MNVTVRGLCAVALCFFLAGCRDNLSVESRGRAASSSGDVIRVVFALSGDDIGGSEHQEIMGRIREGVRESDAGEVAGYGFGMGTMEISVKVDGDGGVKVVERIVGDVYPEAKYRIERGSRR